MKKIIIACLSVLLFSGVYAYSPFSEYDHLQIDRQLEASRSLSYGEKKEKSDFFSRLAQKSLLIRQAFSPDLKYKIPGAKLTADDYRFVNKRIFALKALSETRRADALEVLKITQKLAYEIARSLEIEMMPSFDGYAITMIPTPLYWLQKGDVDINMIMGGQGTTGLKLDPWNLIRETAVVLPPGTVVSLLNNISVGGFVYYEVRTREFDIGPGAKAGYFLDSRFIKKVDSKPHERISHLPTKENILKNLLKTKGAAYVRGGAWYQGIPEMDQFYPSSFPLSSDHYQQKIMKGIDCSGLLYQATDAFTPRNTRQLLSFGDSVEIKDLTASQIAKKLKPLDIIVWAGHVVIVLDDQHTIESRWRANFKGGVEVVPTVSRLQEIMKTRKPVNDYYSSSLSNSKKFVVRRWYKG